ncbi:hypothetical protein [Bacillus sp. 1P06AnD]|uniref:hypothetical protein n=1 Tax=Bacillus sp. 1P06AnD TaxID=3132208 RepID=UPI00399F30CC
MMILGVGLIPIFLVSLYILFKFSWGEEGKDERGQKILNKSFMVAAPILPIGWLLIEMTLKFYDVSYNFYRDAMWILILFTFITQGTTIYVFKQKI